MRYVGTQAYGVRLPIIMENDNLPKIVVKSTLQLAQSMNIEIEEMDVVGITESIAAKAQGNFANITDVADDIRDKFQGEEVGVVFPILSRNRFLNILKGISMGAKKVYVLLHYPSDEVGNPIVNYNTFDSLEDKLGGLMTAKEFTEIVGEFVHPYTNVDYITLYENVSPNIEVYFSKDSRDILKLTKNVLVSEIHTKERTYKKIKEAGSEKIFTLSDILSHSINGSGYNEEHGLLGSNLSKDDSLKLFPRDCHTLIKNVEKEFMNTIGLSPQILVYGDGAYKDPVAKIWELADPVVAPAYSEYLGGTPNEIKLKYVADNILSDLSPKEKEKAMAELIKNKHKENKYSDGTTPRKYADLLGSLCDLVSGSGDKGTPVVLVCGYFDDYSV